MRQTITPTNAMLTVIGFHVVIGPSVTMFCENLTKNMKFYIH